MPAQEHQNPDEKDELAFFRKHPSEIEENIRHTSENQTENDPFRKQCPWTADDAENHKAEGGESLQYDSGDIVLSVFLLKKNGRKYQAEKEKQDDHLQHALS